MKTKEWTKEWYEFLSTEALNEALDDARESYQNSIRWEQEAATLMWSFRVKNLQAEISQRVNNKNTPGISPAA